LFTVNDVHNTEEAVVPASRKWLVLALVLIAESMDLLDTTIVNVAAPDIHEELGAGTAALQWIIGGYALSFAMGLVLGGRLGDIYGRRRLFVLGAVGFLVSSALCAVSIGSGMLIACRLLEGFAAALLIPQGLGIIHAVFADEEREAAFAFFSPVVAGSAVLGPILGGGLIGIDLWGAGWRLIFLVNLPLGLVAALGAAFLMPESTAGRRPSLDVVGAVLAATGMGLLIYPLIQGREAGWPAWTYVMMIGGIVPFGVLALWSRHLAARGRDPLIEPAILVRRQYVTGLGAILVFYTGMMGTLLVVTLFLQMGAGFSAIRAGMTIAPFAFGIAIGAVLAAALLVPRIGRWALQLGALPFAAGVWWIHQTVGAHGLAITTLQLVGPELVAGVGMGLVVGPLFDFILAAVAGDEVGSASGVLNTVQQLAGALGVAAIGTLFFSTLAREGYVVALRHALVAELASVPLLFLLLGALPRRAREDGSGASAAALEKDVAVVP